MTEIAPNAYSVDGLGNVRLLHISAGGTESVDVPFTETAYDEIRQTLADEEAARLAQPLPGA